MHFSLPLAKGHLSNKATISWQIGWPYYKGITAYTYTPAPGNSYTILTNGSTGNVFNPVIRHYLAGHMTVLGFLVEAETIFLLPLAIYVVSIYVENYFHTFLYKSLSLLLQTRFRYGFTDSVTIFTDPVTVLTDSVTVVTDLLPWLQFFLQILLQFSQILLQFLQIMSQFLQFV